jgi:hypothetical protein
MPDTPAPPAFAWDWLGRQRLVWVEARRRLAPAPAADPRPADVPDWSDLLDRGPVRRALGADDADGGGPDWAALATRAEVVAALRDAYGHDPAVRAAVDGAVADVAFLGRRGGDLAALGVRTPPRGLRWWWAHLGGVDADPVPVEPRAAGVQLTLADVMTGYGDPAPVG